MKLIDTHAHLNFNNFKNDADSVIQRSLAEDTWLINVGVDLKTSRRTLYYANKYERGVYAAVGLHPMHLFSFDAKTDDYDFTTRGEEFNYDVYEQLAKFPKVVAIGEVGLDYYHMNIGENKEEIKQKQKETFYQQLLLARKLDKPVIIHCREAHDDMIALLKEFRKEYKDLIPDDFWGVMHCFSGDEDLAWQYFNFGLMISFTGIITFSRQWDELIRKLPNDRFMVETDCPFLTPEPFRGQRNEPAYVKYIANRIAEIKHLENDRIAEISTNNAKKLFKLYDK
ncbi:MAG: TatD family hydrolase [Patescibacteria group bacterium]|nr:TatD family hydrolase [Patescibacteria group bacterium]